MKNSDKKIPNEEQNEKMNPKKTGTASDPRPAMHNADTKMQNPNRNLPQGGNPVGRDTAQHNSVSGGKSLQGNNARSNPHSDKTHN
ncbi:hypothetical protein I5M27_18360 [Adhaeribacter sp. BT258]|uniref:Uncharacterized protein n=1 Tax=Adhaeribacter terrigena TaxID=2793070 RepID=A0ABS1C8P7_9BACT|nr:hypothetical protein [Adhaeribacter terrigena]MBK0404960.1 hypothetical protein [Adhaeribacter terrigena]